MKNTIVLCSKSDLQKARKYYAKNHEDDEQIRVRTLPHDDPYVVNFLVDCHDDMPNTVCIDVPVKEFKEYLWLIAPMISILRGDGVKIETTADINEVIGAV